MERGGRARAGTEAEGTETARRFEGTEGTVTAVEGTCAEWGAEMEGPALGAGRGDRFGGNGSNAQTQSGQQW